MANRKGYATVYWGKMPVNFRPQDFPKHEVEAAIGYAERSFRDVSGPGAGLQRADAGRWPGGRHRGRARAGRREGGDGPPARRARALEPRRAAVGGRPAHPGAAQAGDEAQARPEWVSARRPLGAQAHRTGAVRPSGTIPRAAAALARVRRRGPCCPYSRECVEGLFSDLRLHRILKSWASRGHHASELACLVCLCRLGVCFGHGGKRMP